MAPFQSISMESINNCYTRVTFSVYRFFFSTIAKRVSSISIKYTINRVNMNVRACVNNYLINLESVRSCWNRLKHVRQVLAVMRTIPIQSRDEWRGKVKPKPNTRSSVYCLHASSNNLFIVNSPNTVSRSTVSCFTRLSEIGYTKGIVSIFFEFVMFRYFRTIIDREIIVGHIVNEILRMRTVIT